MKTTPTLFCLRPERLAVAAFYLLALFALPLVKAAGLPQSLRLDSPGGLVVSQFGVNDEKRLCYSVQYDGRPLLETAPLGITVDGVDLGAEVEITGFSKPETVSKTLASPRGVSSQARVALRQVASKIEYAVEVRAFDDGLAFRYVVPNQAGRKIGSEATSYQLPPKTTLWFAQGHICYEGHYWAGPVENLQPTPQLMAPVVFKTPDGKSLGAITEGGLVDYVGHRFQSAGGGRLNVVFHDQTEFVQTDDIISPWRVVMTARNLDGLVNNTVLRGLAPPPAPELLKADWIVPSRLGWSWMAGGGAKGVTLENMKRYVAACADLGFEGNLVDDGWSHWNGGGEKAWAQIKELVEYSNKLGMKTWLWKACPDRKGIPGLYKPAAREDFFRRCAELGVAGVKLDFIDSENLKAVNFMRDTLEVAARYKLMVNFHGSNKPTGLEYTWPHEMSREGIRGQEYGRNPSLDQRHPFGRLIAGQGDYSPFWSQGAATRGHYLATLVTYTSSLLLPCEHPEIIRDLPEAEFFKSVPVIWDETRVLPPSEFGQCVVFARRQSGSWFLALTNDKAPRKVEVPLNFLGAGPWLAQIYTDAPENPDSAASAQRVLRSQDTLTYDMLTYGGGVARFGKIGLNRYGGRLPAGEKIQVATADPKSEVRYTLDGSEPTQASPPCPAEGITIDRPVRLRVKIVAGDGFGSELAYSYSVSEKAP